MRLIESAAMISIAYPVGFDLARVLHFGAGILFHDGEAITDLQPQLTRWGLCAAQIQCPLTAAGN